MQFSTITLYAAHSTDVQDDAKVSQVVASAQRAGWVGIQQLTSTGIPVGAAVEQHMTITSNKYIMHTTVSIHVHR